ncbi:MAG: hypothetical protein C7B43_09575 [Sulfobacillus benefaciens]|uniref:Uncharacterized protein n=1 Tax=Sulfobacillus benefaciens TaxID=453960 RepID=A0A2T2X2D8_9FIRM|nr:MAG: hypothetical protein C7B43_09575 [Sulfobacillus benefaciens]
MHGVFGQHAMYLSNMGGFWGISKAIRDASMRWHYVRQKLPALCGAKIREAILDDLLPLLWSGRVDAVIAYLQLFWTRI